MQAPYQSGVQFFLRNHIIKESEKVYFETPFEHNIYKSNKIRFFT